MEIRPEIVVTIVAPLAIIGGIFGFVGCDHASGDGGSPPVEGPQSASLCPNLPDAEATQLDAGVLEASPLSCTGKYCESEFEEVQSKRNEKAQDDQDCDDAKENIKNLADFVEERCDDYNETSNKYNEQTAECTACLQGCPARTGRECGWACTGGDCPAECNPLCQLQGQMQCDMNAWNTAEMAYGGPEQAARQTNADLATANAAIALDKLDACECEHNCTDGGDNHCKAGNVCQPGDLYNHEVEAGTLSCCMSGQLFEDPKTGGPVLEKFCVPNPNNDPEEPYVVQENSGVNGCPAPPAAPDCSSDSDASM